MWSKRYAFEYKFMENMVQKRIDLDIETNDYDGFPNSPWNLLD